MSSIKPLTKSYLNAVGTNAFTASRAAAVAVDDDEEADDSTVSCKPARRAWRNKAARWRGASWRTAASVLLKKLV